MKNSLLTLFASLMLIFFSCKDNLPVAGHTNTSDTVNACNTSREQEKKFLTDKRKDTVFVVDEDNLGDFDTTVFTHIAKESE